MFYSNLVFKALIFKIILIVFVLSGCSSTNELFRESSLDENLETDYSIIYYIHADSDYLYYDTTGDPVYGNSLVLETAHKVAEEAKSGEVFIFYQSAEKRFLGLFPRKSSRFYHYTNGKLTSRVMYRHSNKSEEFLSTEAQLYHQYRIQSRREDQKNHFLYLGHEIPLENGKKYHRTLPDIDVHIESFSNGLQKFLRGDGQLFDLVVLSTCNNGSPTMVEYLLPISNTVIASPQNLHLSHIDSESLHDLESNPKISSLELARSMAEKTYSRLEKEILTTITLAVYDLEVIREYKSELQSFNASYEELNYSPFYSDNIDCKEVDIFDSVLFSKGLMTWYKPARFGRRSNSITHSGWGCIPLGQNHTNE